MGAFAGGAGADAVVPGQAQPHVPEHREEDLGGGLVSPGAAEVGLEYTDDSSIADVIDDFWTQFMNDPNDEIEHCQTNWIDDCCEKNRTVDELKKQTRSQELGSSKSSVESSIGQGKLLT